MCAFVARVSTNGRVTRNQRTIQHDDEYWTVREVDARGVPGAVSASCLIGESSNVVRRLWRYPTDWGSLTDDELWSLLERGRPD